MTYPRIWFFALIIAACSAHAAEPREMPLWPGVPPGSEGMTAPEKWEERGKDGVTNRAVRQVHQPTLTLWLPEKAQATGVAVILAPGGGYEHVTIDLEGHDVARWLMAHGIAGIVLKYRLPKTPGAPYTNETALADAAEALRVTRAHAAEWNCDPAKVGLVGFSAGGNLAYLAGTKLPTEQRPAFVGLLYPALPENPGTGLSAMPPAFIAQANDDALGTEKAAALYLGMRASKMPAELHLFAKGGHGFGLGRPGTPTKEWPQLFADWLAVSGFIAAH